MTLERSEKYPEVLRPSFLNIQKFSQGNLNWFEVAYKDFSI